MPPLPVGRGQRLCPRRGNDAMSLSANALCRPAPSSVGAPIKRGPGLFPAPPGGGRAQRAQSRGGGLRPPPLLWFCRPAGPAKHRRPPRRPSFLRRQGALPAPPFASASPSCGREKTMRPAPLRSGCPRRSQSAIIGSHCDLPSPTVARIWRSPARPPGAQHVCNRMGKPSVLFFRGK